MFPIPVTGNARVAHEHLGHYIKEDGMKNATIIIGLIVSLLAACSDSSQLPSELAALALPGAPGDSQQNYHNFYSSWWNSHRATVVAKRSSTTNKSSVYVYQADSYIPVTARFEVDLGGSHASSNVRVKVSASSSWIPPVYCSWKLNSSSILSCSSSGIQGHLSSDTLYTVTVEEYKPGTKALPGQWLVITKAYFRTEPPSTTF
jgi:hypothetical protein